MGALACSQGAARGLPEGVGTTTQAASGDTLLFKSTSAPVTSAGEQPATPGACTLTYPDPDAGAADGGDASTDPYYDCEDTALSDNVAHADWNESTAPCTDGGADAGADAAPKCLGETKDDSAYGPHRAVATATVAKAHADVTTTAGVLAVLNAGIAAPSADVTGTGTANITTTVSPPYYRLGRHSNYHGTSKATGPGYTIVDHNLSTSCGRALVTENVRLLVQYAGGYGTSGSASATAGSTTASITCSKFAIKCQVTTTTSAVRHGSQCPGGAAECTVAVTNTYDVPAGGDGGGSGTVSIPVMLTGKRIGACGDSVNVQSSNTLGSAIKGDDEGTIRNSSPVSETTLATASITAMECPATGNCQ